MSRKAKVVEALSHPDAALIDDCITFAAAMRAASGAFEADPTGDNDFAQRRDNKFLKDARRALASAAALKPATLDGLRTKANIVGLVIDNNDPSADAFMKAFARDVILFHNAVGEAKLLATDAAVTA